MDKDRISYLFKQYITDKCTTEEEAEFFEILSQSNHEGLLTAFFDEFWMGLGNSSLTGPNADKAARIMADIISKPQQKPRSRYVWINWAAAILVIATLAAAFLPANIYQHIFNSRNVGLNDTLDVLPGSHKAVLTFSNGRSIKLNTHQSGIIIKEKELAYEDGSEVVDEIPSLKQLKLTTPKGGEYTATLSDGTKVTMNAASTLIYPGQFKNNGPREVFLEGEAFFDVATSSGQPFHVKSVNQCIDVLGTSFNVAVYKEDGLAITTLKSGKVRVLNIKAAVNNNSIILIPGQQSIIRAGEVDITLRKEDVADAFAWKEGLFVFDNEDIHSMMQRLARWYNVEVRYEGDVSGVKFLGNYSRKKSLRNLLKNIAETGKVKFRIENNGSSNTKQIVVMGT